MKEVILIACFALSCAALSDFTKPKPWTPPEQLPICDIQICFSI